MSVDTGLVTPFIKKGALFFFEEEEISFFFSGDNFATWDHLYYSIPGMLQFQLFGITYVGADICGFISDTTEELCARWMQLGSFYTFSRNHNTISARSQEPYLWESVAKNSRTSLAIRYSLLNYYYTLLYQASQNGAAVIRPLFYEHPSDSTTFAIDRQFYVGASILVTPVLSQGATSVTGYLPAGEWYDWYTLTKIAHLVVGEYRDFTAPLDYIPIHIRGGGIIPTQSPGYTTTETRSNPFELIVALNSDLTASGFLYADDGYYPLFFFKSFSCLILLISLCCYFFTQRLDRHPRFSYHKDHLHGRQ